MRHFWRFINKTLSIRLSLMVVTAMTLLLMASLFVMLYFARKTIKEEALLKATQTLQSTVERIDNILLSVEQTTGNTYFSMLPDLHNREMMFTYCRELVESNPYIVGGAIAMKPGYFDNGQEFMAYYHREIADGVPMTEAPLQQMSQYNNQSYTIQKWYAHPMQSNKPGWMSPLERMENVKEPIITFSLPIPGPDGKPVGVIGADVSLSLLSQIVLDAKPSKNSYCTLLNGDGSFIVHPNGSQLLYQTAYTMSRHAGNPSLREAVEAMVSGETGYKAFTVNGNRFYVFYKPFTRAVVPGRSMEELSWSAGMVYPEEDIFGDYNSLSYYVLFIAIIGLLTIFLLSRAIIHRQLKPLAMLTESAQRIAKGNYTEPIPVSKQRDEVGQLQNCFHQMQESLASNIGQLEQLQATLQERGESLRKAYKHAKKADRVKTIFLHYMTNQMTGPAENIENAVNTLCNGTATNRSEVVDDIVANGKTIAELLDNLINTSDEEMRKEVEHD